MWGGGGVCVCVVCVCGVCVCVVCVCCVCVLCVCVVCVWCVAAWCGWAVVFLGGFGDFGCTFGAACCLLVLFLIF